ncbi:hypothetical protein CYMTET_22574 [Cymbomonas tetramitiformis]|uniref:Uncharacterized protein n=1 Tax=Cymbomonas tetramitiformis TaxID=36881 RepID=A0AAE0L1S3_9CHLO|nr:hypothetical protein CYMTET_22574 [Cymbomonas tetramitiformis]
MPAANEAASVLTYRSVNAATQHDGDGGVECDEADDDDGVEDDEDDAGGGIGDDDDDDDHAHAGHELDILFQYEDDDFADAVDSGGAISLRDNFAKSDEDVDDELTASQHVRQLLGRRRGSNKGSIMRGPRM